MSWSLRDIPNPSFNQALDDWITREPERSHYDDEDDEDDDDEEWD